MGFKDAKAKLSEYFDTRADNITKGQPLEWVDDIDELLKTCNRDDERGTYSKLRAAPEGADKREVINVRTRIAWLCACERDLRIQFKKADGNERVLRDNYRYMASRYKYIAQNALRHLEVYTDERKEDNK